MLIIQDKLISDDVIEEKFACHLQSCKGACCWEGDFGAPLEEEELKIMEKIYKNISPYLSEEGIDTIERKGVYEFFDKAGEYGTPLQENGACAYLVFEDAGIAKCGIEKAFEEGAIDFPKPISCHLYPVRITEDKNSGFVAVNYDRWDICKSACSHGEKRGIPLFEFIKNGLVRKFGLRIYEELKAAAEHYRQKRESY